MAWPCEKWLTFSWPVGHFRPPPPPPSFWVKLYINDLIDHTMSQTTLHTVRNNSIYIVHFLSIPQDFFSQKKLLNPSRTPQKCLMNTSRTPQEHLKNGLRTPQECLKNASRTAQEHLNNALTAPQECFKNASTSRMLQEYLKNASIMP